MIFLEEIATIDKIVIKKVCKGECGKEKPLSEFKKGINCRFGKAGICKECDAKISRANVLKRRERNSQFQII